ncbi:RNA polymerase sigma factor [Asticcacaulis sp. AND118]|uniref:RNA polymerase sigma factor n=1 Tax=Asticcacaulis sp. AND118 TaxID=2840468 RepID=UPI001CFFCCE6|nr:sigma-70 family RNA polymerase sigma factor [Asticcacaulis sp. AND118]UDF05595.1 sigma-70 family RNA polymerase sigma factor [Asticcacaulis sp. AND118]
MRASDERALWLSRFVLPHEPALRAWLSHRRIDGLDVDDIVQETYARLIAVRSVDDIGNIKNYMFQTAYSVMISHVRRAKVVPFHVVSDLDELGAMAEGSSPEQQTADRDELRRLAAAIATLPGKVRDVFVLRRVSGLSQRDVARKLGLSESTVEKHMSRGIYLLMNLLSNGGNLNARASRTWANKVHKSDAGRDGSKDRQRD